MGDPRRLRVNITTDSSGNAVGYTECFKGVIERIEYAKTDFADGVDFDITLEDSGFVLWDEDNVNASKTIAPRLATHTTAGAAALYAASGVAVLDKVVNPNERVKVSIAQGGNTKTGTFYVVVN